MNGSPASCAARTRSRYVANSALARWVGVVLAFGYAFGDGFFALLVNDIGCEYHDIRSCFVCYRRGAGGYGGGLPFQHYLDDCCDGIMMRGLGYFVQRDYCDAGQEYDAEYDRAGDHAGAECRISHSLLALLI